MELREKIAAELLRVAVEHEGQNAAKVRHLWGPMADAILALPEIRDALDVRRSTMRAQGYDADC